MAWQRWVAVVTAMVELCGCAGPDRLRPLVPEPAPGVSGTTGSTGSSAAETAAAKAELAAGITVEPWEFAGTRGQRLLTAHYRIHTTVENAYLLEQLPHYAEEALAHYTSAITSLPMPQRPFETYLFGSRRQWEAKTRQLLPDQAKMYLNLGRGGYTTRGIAVLYDIDAWGARDTLAIAAHEGWHQYTQQVFRQPLPPWLEEGLATYMEGHSGFRGQAPQFLPWKNRERFEALRQAARSNKLIPLPELLKRSPQTFLDSNNKDLLVYYAQVWALTHFLVEGDGGRHRPGLETMLQEAATGRITGRLSAATSGQPRRRGGPGADQLGVALAQAYFDSDLTQMTEAYDRFVHAVVGAPGASSAIAAGRSPLAGH